MLVLVLVLATVFVILSAWQFGVSRTDDSPVANEQLDTPEELTEIYVPNQPMSVYEADQVVDVRGEFVEDTQVLIDSRINNGESGYWVVAAFEVAGSPNGDDVIPVVRGWAAETHDADSPPTGQLEIQGRLLPTEAPGEGPRVDLPVGVLPTLSVAELINLWDRNSYGGFVVDFSGEALSAQENLETVWVDVQPEGSSVNWLNLFYAVEWVVFAGFAFYLWWRMVKDAHIKRQEEEELDRQWQQQWQQEQLAKRRAERQSVTGTDEE